MSATAERDAVRHAISTSTRPSRPSAGSAAVTFAWRGMRKIRHVPEQLLDSTLTPVMFLLMFVYLFGGEVSGSTGDYLEYILPGILVQSALFTTVYSGVALNTDMTKGTIDRFRSIAIWQPAPLAGAAIGDMVRAGIASAVTLAVGFLMGFGAGGGVGGVLAATALVMVFAFGLSWVFATVGLIMRAPNAVLNTGFMVLFPLVFLSNIFVDPETLPAGLEAFVDVNPISHLVSATRDLMEGHDASDDILISLACAAGLTAVFAPLTARLYRTKG